ncbi:MAG: hypothetical protein K8M05_12010 [Deltaproteobacteria bacterium]|nr:hypothetical protein [Kofleriaceae bacterium]
MRSSAPLALALLTPLAVTACGDSEDGDDLLAPPPPGQGVQFRMETTIPAGVEGEWCQFLTGPAAEMWIERDEVRFTEGSHHVLLYETGYAQIPTVKLDGTRVDTSGVFDCSDGPTAGWNITKLLGGSQNATGDSLLAFPDGVAMHVAAGSVVLMNAHYLNATDADLRPIAAINLWTRPAAEIETEGDLLFLYNPLIKVPANGTGRARWRCPVHEDITISNVQSHMHKRGTGYSAAVTGQAAFYENDRWEGVPVTRFEGGLTVTAGSTLDYWCDYENHEARDVYQGARTTDEMCMLIGSYYPANPRTSNCELATGGFGGEWVGNGTATCADTYTCMQTATQAADVVRAVTDCIDAASPSVAAESSAVLRCLANSDDPATECQAAITACQAL